MLRYPEEIYADRVKELEALIAFQQSHIAYLKGHLAGEARLIAIGDDIIKFAEHHNDCPAVEGLCECGYDAVIRQWNDITAE